MEDTTLKLIMAQVLDVSVRKCENIQYRHLILCESGVDWRGVE